MFAKRLIAAQSCGGENQSKENLPRSPEPKACLKRAHPRTAPPEANVSARSAGFQTCRIADFQVGKALGITQLAGLETRATADLDVCATETVRGCARQAGGGSGSGTIYGFWSAEHCSASCKPRFTRSDAPRSVFTLAFSLQPSPRWLTIARRFDSLSPE
jgi:hypothetical protein